MKTDAELRARFAALRHEDATGAPPFERLLQANARPAVARRPPAPAPGLALRFAAAAGIAVAVAGLLVWRVGIHERAMPGARSAMPLADWRSPTDFLLDTSGSAVLREVPRIGDPQLDVAVPIGRHAQERTT